MRLPKRVALGVCATGLVLWPATAGAGSGVDDAPPPDPQAILDAVLFYSAELFTIDLDGDGVFDVTDSDGDGVPEVPVGGTGAPRHHSCGPQLRYADRRGAPKVWASPTSSTSMMAPRSSATAAAWPCRSMATVR